MAAKRTKKRTRSRRAPRRTRNWVYIRGRWMHVVYYDGFAMRQMQPDLDIMLWHGDQSLVDSGFVPSDEIWIDSAYADETDHFLKIYRIASRRRWLKRPYKELRAHLKQELCRTGPIPPFVEREERDEENGLHIVYVRGEIVRQYFDPHFMFGGHDLVYGEYITSPRTVWIDVRQDPRELEYTLFHETTERKLMERGWNYDDAHDRTTELELRARARKHLVWPVRKEKRLLTAKLEPLVAPTAQEGDATCGPRSLKMVLDTLKRKWRGQPFTEKMLAELSGCGEEGTDHAGLIRAAKAVGANVFVKEHGTIDELRHFILKERLPVLVGWWAGPERTMVEIHADEEVDEGHFSVVSHLTRSQIWLADPWIIDPKDENKGAAGIRRISLKKFMRQSNVARPEFSWCDTDTPRYLPTNRWYMVLNFEGKTFRFPGGANY